MIHCFELLLQRQLRTTTYIIFIKLRITLPYNITEVVSVMLFSIFISLRGVLSKTIGIAQLTSRKAAYTSATILNHPHVTSFCFSEHNDKVSAENAHQLDIEQLVL